MAKIVSNTKIGNWNSLKTALLNSYSERRAIHAQQRIGIIKTNGKEFFF